MDLPNAATKGVEKALKPQNIIFAVVLTIIVIMIAQFLIKQEVIETDENGNVVKRGYIKPSLKIGFKK